MEKTKPLAKGDIVGMKDDGPWSPYQGLVVDPNSTIEGDGYCVAVYFDREVSADHFRARDSGIESWDEKYGKGGGSEAVLSDSNLITTCPRIVFFRPDELVVEAEWKIEHLAYRTFRRNNVHTVNSVKDFVFKSGTHACWLEGCESVAVKPAFFNVWGSVFLICTCQACFEKTNGWCGDSLPQLKKSLPGVTPKLVAVAA